MTKAANITIINPGPGVGPFTLYALDAGGNIVQTIQTHVPLSSLIGSGLNVYGLPSSTTAIEVVSENALCNNNYTVTIPVKTPPACNCITFMKLTEATGTYTYTNCSGTVVGPNSLAGAIQVCGYNPTVSNRSIIMTQGTPCISNGKTLVCETGTLILSNQTVAVERGGWTLKNVTPRQFYSFNSSPTYPDNPQIVLPVSTGVVTAAATRIPYNGPITVTIGNTTGTATTVTTALYVNGTLKESINALTNISADTYVVLNQTNPYTFNPTDEVKIVIYNQF